MCSKQPRLVDYRSCLQQARLSTSFADNTTNLPWRNFLQVEVSLHANNQLDSSSGFDTVPACDGRTDGRTDRQTDRGTTDRGTHDDSINRANIASRGKIVDSKAELIESSLKL